jgi:hypothetical protein
MTTTIEKLKMGTGNPINQDYFVLTRVIYFPNLVSIIGYNSCFHHKTAVELFFISLKTSLFSDSFFMCKKSKLVNVRTTLWVRASGFEWHVHHKVVRTLTFYVQKHRKIRMSTDCSYLIQMV